MYHYINVDPIKNMLQFLLISAHHPTESNLVSRHNYHLPVHCDRMGIPLILDNVCCSLTLLNTVVKLSKMAWSRENQFQHMRLHHFSYITLLKLQHILWASPFQSSMTHFCMIIWIQWKHFATFQSIMSFPPDINLIRRLCDLVSFQLSGDHI